MSKVGFDLSTRVAAVDPEQPKQQPVQLVGCSVDSIQVGQNVVYLHQPTATRVARSCKSNDAQS